MVLAWDYWENQNITNPLFGKDAYMNPFEGKTIRSRLDRATNRRWYSVVDICAAILGCDYQKARSYWKWLKAKSQKLENDTTSITFQLKFEAADGKMRRTDVMDACGVLGLLSSWPSGRGAYARHWLAKIETEYENAAGLVSETIPNVECKAGNLLYKVVRTVVYDSKIHGEPGGNNADAESRGGCVNINPAKPPKSITLKRTGANYEKHGSAACVSAFINLSRHQAAISKICYMSRCA